MSRKKLVPGAEEGLDKFKMEVAKEMGMSDDEDEAYKGNITSKVNGYTGGSLGGNMVKKMVEEYEKKLKWFINK